MHHLGPIDIAEIPDTLVSDSDDRLNQGEVLNQIIATSTLQDSSNVDNFDEKSVKPIRLSALKRYYEAKDRYVVNLLSDRHSIEIDEEFRFRVGTDDMLMQTNKTMLDYHLTVAKCVGVSALLPNAASAPRFLFEMDLKKPYREFKGKHAMVGFDTKGRMLYIGKAMNEDVYLAMAPNAFISCEEEPRPAGYSTGTSQMSGRHARQVIIMLLHFLSHIKERSYLSLKDIYTHDLDDAHLDMKRVSTAM
jgi:hypothetical protein